jgi:hypothetical protein
MLKLDYYSTVPGPRHRWLLISVLLVALLCLAGAFILVFLVRQRESRLAQAQLSAAKAARTAAIANFSAVSG